MDSELIFMPAGYTYRASSDRAFKRNLSERSVVSRMEQGFRAAVAIVAALLLCQESRLLFTGTVLLVLMGFLNNMWPARVLTVAMLVLARQMFVQEASDPSYTQTVTMHMVVPWMGGIMLACVCIDQFLVRSAERRGDAY